MEWADEWPLPVKCLYECHFLYILYLHAILIYVFMIFLNTYFVLFSFI